MPTKSIIASVVISTLSLSGIGCSSDTAPSTQSATNTKQVIQHSSSSPLAVTAQKKILQLEQLMAQAEAKGIDTTREVTTLWFANEFLMYADWDEKHPEVIEKFFANYRPFAEDKVKYTLYLPNFEREKVIEILDTGINNLTRALNGEIKIKPVNKVDWQNVEASDNMFVSNGRPIFLYDYFSKSMGNPTSDERIYNDHLGNIDRVPSINPYMLNAQGKVNKNKLAKLANHPDTKIGYALYWNSGIPNWVKAQEPEVEKGRSLFTGFDIDNPLMQELWGEIVRETGRVTQGKKAVKMGYILSNEPHWFSEQKHWTQNFKEMTSISSYTHANFRLWLTDTYNNDIHALNKNWQSNFNNFDSITIEIPISPKERGKPKWYDWCRYNMHRSTQWFSYLQDELLAVNPQADTNIKIMPDLFTEEYRSHGIDLEALTELTTMIGNDAKTMKRDLRSKKPEHWEARYSYNWEELAVSYDFMESVAPNKIHVNSETHFLSSSWWRELDTSTDYVRNTFWLSTLLGMDAGLSWFWARDPDGSPEDRLEGKLKFFDPAMAGSYAASVAMQPQVANELPQVMMDLNSFSEEIIALREQKRPIRLFYSETSAINKHHHMADQFHLYESLFFEGFPVGYATENIIKKQDNSQWDVIVVYKTEFVTDSEFNALQHYLDNGGTIIIDSENSLAKNEYGQKRVTRLKQGKGSLTFAKQANSETIKQLALANAQQGITDIKLSEHNKNGAKGCIWRIVKQKNGDYLMTIVNIGNSTATLNLQSSNQQSLTATNLLTSETHSPHFELASNGVLLLTVQASAN